MKFKNWRWLIPAFVAALAFVVLPLVSCTSTSSSPNFYDAGASNLTASGAQIAQYWLFRFDTSAASRTLTTANAADIVGALQSPFVGQVVFFAVSADGTNSVSILGGSNVTVKSSASNVPANTTLTVYCVLDNISSGSEAVTIY
jgi:hypothetical protein